MSTDQDTHPNLMDPFLGSEANRNNNNGNDSIDGRKDNTTLGEKEIDILNKHESTSQGILEVVGLQQTVNIAVFFVKADLTINYLYYITSVNIVVSVVAQILLASLVAAKIFIRKGIREERKKIKKGKGDVRSLKRMQKRLHRFNFTTLLLVLFITILTTMLLATSGMIDVRRPGTHIMESAPVSMISKHDPTG